MTNILFSTEMVRAILNGDKTQTRRVIKPQPRTDSRNVHVTNNNLYFVGGHLLPPCPYGGAGNEIWVRETWRTYVRRNRPFIQYKADEAEVAISYERYEHLQFNKRRITWRPSIFMPRWASRITLTVTAVRVEQLRDITEADAVQEGIDRTAIHGDYTARFNFQRLWETINAKRGYGWDTNPWVWVIEFEMKEATP